MLSLSLYAALVQKIQSHNFYLYYLQKYMYSNYYYLVQLFK